MPEDRPAPEPILPAVSIPSTPEKPTAGGFLRFASANALAFLLIVLASLQIPLWVSQADYGSFRVMLLYLTFSGALHLGLLDYALVTFAQRGGTGGRSAFLHDLRELLAVTGVGGAALIVAGPHLVGDFTLGAALAVNAVLQNAAGFGEIVLQTSGRFQRLNVVRLGRALLWLGSVWALHLFQGLDITTLLAAYTAVQLAATTIFLALAAPDRGEQPAGAQTLPGPGTVQKILYGFPILAGGFLLLLVANADRNFLSVTVPREKFAVYAFGAMLLSLVRDMMVSARTYLFPHLAREEEAVRRSRFERRELAVAGLLAVLALFLVPASAFGPGLFPAYAESFRLLPFLYAAFAFDAVSVVLLDSYLAALKLNKDILRLAAALTAAVYLGLVLVPVLLPGIELITVARLAVGIGFVRFVAYDTFLRKRLALGAKGVVPAMGLLLLVYIVVELGVRIS